jgi:hypothetical protein
MRTYLRTRGRVRDYQFIGVAPEVTWWRSYARVTDLETPAVLVESSGRAWRAYVSGIQSGRRDRIGRPIFMDIVLEGEGVTEGARDRELALAIIVINIGLGDGDGDGDGADGAGEQAAARCLPPGRLDAVITEEVVEGWLAEPSPSASRAAAAAIGEVFRDVPATPAGDSVPSQGDPAGSDWAGADWVGGLGSARSRAAFLALAGRLLSGAAGRALMLSYVADLQDVREIPGVTDAWTPHEGVLGVLAASHGPLSRADPAKLVR